MDDRAILPNTITITCGNGRAVIFLACPDLTQGDELRLNISGCFLFYMAKQPSMPRLSSATALY